MGVTAPDAPTAPPAPSLWRNRDYLLLWSGQIVSTLGSSVSGIAVPLLILALTGSPEAAGFAGAFVTVPYVLLSLPVGALVDRWDRKRVMIICDAARACAFGSIPLALAFNALTLWQLYAVALAEGSLFVFFNLAEVAALPRVVRKDQLSTATSQNMATQGVAGLIGPGLGGWLFQAVGHGAPFAADAISFVASVLSLLFVRTRFQETKAPAERNLRAEIVEGLAWAWREPTVRITSFMSGCINFVFVGSPLIVIVLARNLHADEAAIGSIFSIGGIGAVVGAVSAARLSRRFSVRQITVGTTIATAVLFPLQAVAPNVLALGLLAAVMTFLTPVYSVAVLSYRLALIPDALQGRVNSAVRLVAFGFQPLGAALAGILLEQIGPNPTIAAFTAVLATLALLSLRSPAFRAARPLPTTTPLPTAEG